MRSNQFHQHFTFYPIDPCASLPCQHNGLCIPFTDNSGFQCHCVEIFYGPVCEKGIWLFFTHNARSFVEFLFVSDVAFDKENWVNNIFLERIVTVILDQCVYLVIWWKIIWEFLFLANLFGAIDRCGSNDPCINSTCTQVKFPPFYTCENCSHGKRGYNCDIGMIIITL